MTRRKDRSRARAALGLTLTGAALAAVPLSAALAQSGAAESVTVVRTDVALDVAGGDLGPWTPVKSRPEARVRFTRAGDRRVVRLSDGRRQGGYVTLGTSLAPQTAVGSRAEVNLTRQRLGRGRARALLTVTSASGEGVQAGVVRSPRGGLRWAVWTKAADGRRTGVVVSDARATRGSWHRIDLRTRWGRPDARSVLRVDGTPVARTAPRDLSGVLAQRVLLGLGRPSAAEETGTLLVRSAEVRAAVGVADAPPAAESAPTAPTAPVSEPAPPAGAAPATPPAGTAPPANPAMSLPGRLLVSGDWETGDTSQFSSVQTVSSDRIRPVTSPVRQGRYAGRFEVRPGDDPLGYGDRAEVSVSTGESEGDERWYSWSTMAAPGFPSTARFQVISQWHSRANGRPPVAFFAENDDLALYVHRYAAPDDQLSTTKAWSAPLPRGTWVDIAMHVKWSGDDRVGFVELWVNGVPQTLSNGQKRLSTRTMYPGIDNYFKQGYYRQYGISQAGVVYHDGFRMHSAG